jgi:hypothetical protein
MKRAFVMLALAAQLAGCASTRMVQVAGGTTERGPVPPKGLRIMGYTMADGTQHAFRGVVRPSAQGEQLIFKPVVPRPTESVPEAERSFTLPRGDVATLQVVRVNRVRTALLVGMSTAVVLVLTAEHGGQIVD